MKGHTISVKQLRRGSCVPPLLKRWKGLQIWFPPGPVFRKSAEEKCVGLKCVGDASREEGVPCKMFVNFVEVFASAPKPQSNIILTRKSP